MMHILVQFCFRRYCVANSYSVVRVASRRNASKTLGLKRGEKDEGYAIGIVCAWGIYESEEYAIGIVCAWSISKFGYAIRIVCA